MRKLESALNMNTKVSFDITLTYLSMKEIEDTLPHCSFTWSQKCSRAALTEAVNKLLDEDHTSIEEAIRAKKQKHVEVDGTYDGRPTNASSENNSQGEIFFESVMEEIRWERITKFIDVTGNDALATGICTVCAG